MKSTLNTSSAPLNSGSTEKNKMGSIDFQNRKFRLWHYTVLLASFGQIELKNLEIRQYSGGFFVQFASKSDCAIWALDLISASIIEYNYTDLKNDF